MNSIKRLFLIFCDHFHMLNWMNDEKYLSLLFEARNGYKLNLSSPKTFNEKIQWLKLNDRNPIYSLFVDKYEVKKYVAEAIGEEYVTKTYGVFDDFSQIDFSSLPNQFVIKCTHDSGGVVICKDKKTFSIRNAKRKITKSLKNRFYLSGREYQYKNVKPRILIEEYLEDKSLKELVDYKFFTFDGIVKALFVATGRQSKQGPTFDFFDSSYIHLPITNGHPFRSVPPAKPLNFEKMKECAEKLSTGFPHLRIDFYEANGRMYFGEITLYQNSGLVPFKPSEWDYKFGSWITIV